MSAASNQDARQSWVIKPWGRRPGSCLSKADAGRACAPRAGDGAGERKRRMRGLVRLLHALSAWPQLYIYSTADYIIPHNAVALWMQVPCAACRIDISPSGSSSLPRVLYRPAQPAVCSPGSDCYAPVTGCLPATQHPHAWPADTEGGNSSSR